MLNIYLADHLAGAHVGQELAKRCHAANQGTELGRFLEEFQSELEADRAALEELMDRVEAPRDRLKLAVGWLAEKAGRLKLNGQLTGYSPLSRLVEVEGLRLGVEGKLSMWRVIKDNLSGDPRVQTFDFNLLIERAERQREGLEAQRLKAAAIALS